MLIDQCFQVTKILETKYKPENLDDVITSCENLYVEEQQQLNILLLKYKHLSNGTLGEFKMEPISLQLMDPNCKPVHATAYTVPRSVEQQLQQIKDIERFFVNTSKYRKQQNKASNH
jgi:hypothetical protein